jgi:hypothetical protein
VPLEGAFGDPALAMAPAVLAAVQVGDDQWRR